MKKKGKEADDGQPADSEQPKSNSKEANMQKDEGEKPKLSNEDKEGLWVAVAFNKSKRAEVNTQEEKPIKGGKTVNESSSKSTDDANPYKQKKGGKIVNESPKSTDAWKSQETNPYQQPKKGGKSVNESPKAMDTSNNLYKPQQKRDQNWGDEKVDFDYFANEMVKSGTGTDKSVNESPKAMDTSNNLFKPPQKRDHNWGDEKVEFDYFANEMVKSGAGTDNVPKAAKQAESVRRKHKDTFDKHNLGSHAARTAQLRQSAAVKPNIMQSVVDSLGGLTSYLDRQQGPSTMVETAEDHFGKTVAALLKEIKSRKHRRQLQAKILTIIANVESDDSD